MNKIIWSYDLLHIYLFIILQLSSSNVNNIKLEQIGSGRDKYIRSGNGLDECITSGYGHGERKWREIKW